MSIPNHECSCLSAGGPAVLEGVDDAEADEGEHHGDGRHDRHDHPQLGRHEIEKEMLDTMAISNCVSEQIAPLYSQSTFVFSMLRNMRSKTKTPKQKCQLGTKFGL